jgi:4-hydroxybenzoate polyprenyltransferase
MNDALGRTDPEGMPLYVDLDGCLVRGDTLVEMMLLELGRSPVTIVPMLVKLRGGRARLKAWLASRRLPDVTTLPYRGAVLERIREARGKGRRVVLATACHEAWARPIAEHLGLFDDVLATTDGLNLESDAKLARIEEDAGGVGFEYVGDSRADLPIFARASRAGVIAGNRRLVRRVRRVCDDVVVVGRRPSTGRALISALRPHQWLKNVLILMPALLAQVEPTVDVVLTLSLAVATFSLVASSVYIINDAVDIETDRRHDTKRHRSMASGMLPVHYAPLIVTVLLGSSISASLIWLPGPFTAMLLGYFFLSLLYSTWLKRKLLIDVLLLAGLYTWRILAGGAAVGVPVSEWLLAMSAFAFTSLAFVKRYVELMQTDELSEWLDGRGYMSNDLQSVGVFGATSGFMAVLVLALYLNSETVRALYARPEVLWLVCPLLMYWFARIWFLARRGDVHEDPLLFVLKDRVSLLVILLTGVLGATASVGF